MSSRQGELAEFEPIVTAVRVFTTRNRQRKRTPAAPKRRRRRYPFEVLVFDTETTIDPSQNLQVGVWRFYRDDPDGQAGVTCIEEGFFYPDDLPDTDPNGYRALIEYASAHEPDTAPGYAHTQEGIPVWPISEWLEKRFYRYGYRHRNRCVIVGFNLLFDLGRIASHWGEGKGNFLGGWSLGLWGHHRGRKWVDELFHQRVNAKHIDSKRTLFSFGTLNADKDPDPHLRGLKGMFVDLRTLTFALTDRGHTLESACKAFGDPFEKADVEYGVITPGLLHYARADVEHTARLYRACLDELALHPGIELEPHRLYSPATVGAQYLKAMGLALPMEQLDIPTELHGYAMSGFYGGRAEARIVRTHLPVSYVDATSMYPTVNALLGTWRTLTADHLEQVDATGEVTEMLADPGLFEHCFEPDFWREEIGLTLVEVDHPDGALLPVRGEYDETALDPGIGLNPLRYDGTLWYLLPDVITATILTKQPVPIRRAIRLNPVGIQNLNPVRLRGGRTINPTQEDPFVGFIEYRHQTKQDTGLPDEERNRLERFLKITANATSYGALARFDRRRFAKPKDITVYGPDPAFASKTSTPEDPGPYCYPPVAANITAAARLLLAMLQRAVTDAGGHYVLCDTDSMVIVTAKTPTPIECETPDGTNEVTPLTPDKVREILGRFEALNPYDQTLIPELWTQEHGSLDEPIWCYAISSKRYALYRTTTDGDIEMVDWSESGLGQYLDPTGPENPKRDEQGRRIWTRQVWEWVLTGNRRRDSMPDWVDLPALTRFSLSSPQIETWFTGYNRTQPRHQQIRPASFGLLAHTDPLVPTRGDDATPRPTTTYNPDPDTWMTLDWYDRNTGQPIHVTTATPHDSDFNQHLAEGRVRIKTLGDVLAGYRTRPEHKSLAPDGTPTTGETRGQLRLRPVEGATVLTDLIGKEGNELEERTTGISIDPDDYRSQYGVRGDRWNGLVLPILNSLGAEEVMRRSGREKTAVYDVLAGNTRSTGAPAARYLDIAVQEARRRLELDGLRAPRHPYGVLYRARRLIIEKGE